MFKDSIIKAKKLAVTDLRECISTTGIYQTRAFIPVEAYVEFVDSCFRLIWFCLYRDYLESEGLQENFSYGKLLYITTRLNLPQRIYDLAIHTLSPIILKTEVFIPSPELVKCTQYIELEECAPFFSVTLGKPDPLCSRFGLVFRIGMINVLKNLPGAMTKPVIFRTDEVYFVLRNILFLSMKDNMEEEVAQLDLLIEQPPSFVDTPVPQEDEDFTPAKYVEHCDNVVTLLYPDGLAHFEHTHDHKWFIPYVYSRIVDENSFVNALSTYLPLVILSDDDIELSGIRESTLLNDFGLPGTYHPSFVNSIRRDFSAACMQSIKSLRIKECKIAPRFETHEEIYGIIRRVVITHWKDLEFPNLDSQYQWVQPDWTIPTDSPYFPYTIRWTRQVRVEQGIQKPSNLNNKRKGKSLKVRENPHETKDSSIPEKTDNTLK